MAFGASLSEAAPNRADSIGWQLLFALTEAEFPIIEKQAVTELAASGESTREDLFSPFAAQLNDPFPSVAAPSWVTSPAANTCFSNDGIQTSDTRFAQFNDNERIRRASHVSDAVVMRTASQGCESTDWKRRTLSDTGYNSPLQYSAETRARYFGFEGCSFSPTPPHSSEFTSRKSRTSNRKCRGCQADLTDAKPYYRRRKICSTCLTAPAIRKDGIDMRFCQQCSCLHGIERFDGTRRSCRDKLMHRNRKIRANS